MRHNFTNCPACKSGFTLMETALAILVIGLGFLTLIGLGRSGLDSVHEAKNDTRCEVMADSIFETLRIYNQRFREQSMNSTNIQSWASVWSEAISRDDYFPFPPVSGISDGLFLVINSDNDTITPTYDVDNISLNNWHPRYRLEIAPARMSSISYGFDILTVGLTIYPDGDTYSSDERFFTTILTRGGGL